MLSIRCTCPSIFLVLALPFLSLSPQRHATTRLISKNCDRAVRVLKDPAQRQDGKEALRLVDKEVRTLQDEVRRCELNLNHAHAGE